MIEASPKLSSMMDQFCQTLFAFCCFHSTSHSAYCIRLDTYRFFECLEIQIKLSNFHNFFLIWLHLCMTELGLLLVAVLLVFHLKAQEKCQSKRSPPPVVCVGYQGRLGNLMFQYAFLYSVSRNRGLYPVSYTHLTLPPICPV